MHPDREIDIADVCAKRSHQKQKTKQFGKCQNFGIFFDGFPEKI